VVSGYGCRLAMVVGGGDSDHKRSSEGSGGPTTGGSEAVQCEAAGRIRGASDAIGEGRGGGVVRGRDKTGRRTGGRTDNTT
jgi:hypothetical protein